MNIKWHITVDKQGRGKYEAIFFQFFIQLRKYELT